MSQRISSYPRQANECYETPGWVTRIVVRHFRDRYCEDLWDPADGPASKIANALRAEGFRVTATRDDFLRKTASPDAEILSIVTSPPYGPSGRLACAFIEHALKLVPIVAMLLRVDFDSGKTRTHLFRDCAAFTHKIVLLDRIIFFERDDGTAEAPSDNHAWYLWDQRRVERRPPTIGYARQPMESVP
jgi:hypothetical protein